MNIMELSSPYSRERKPPTHQAKFHQLQFNLHISNLTFHQWQFNPCKNVYQKSDTKVKL